MRALAAVLLALAVAGCDARGQTGPARPQAFSVRITPVAPAAPDGRVGELVYAGGFEMTAVGTSLFGGLSGLEVAPDGAVLMVNDSGDLVRGRLALDSSGRLVGLLDLTVEALKGEDGAPLSLDKARVDAEDVTVLPDGGFAVAFERDHRVLAYAAPGARAVRRIDLARTRFEPKPNLPDNTGFEGLAWTPAGLALGAETGRLHLCPDDRTCRERPIRRPGFGWNLTALDSLGDGDRLVSVWRLHPLFAVGWRSAVHGPDGRELAPLDGPLAGNAEGIAAVPNGDGWRLYVVTDDGYGLTGRNLLLAFDWTPAPAVR